MTKIPRQPVTSSQIESIGHNPETQELDIEFKRFSKKGQTEKQNTVYRFQNVTQDEHAALIGAESIGRHFGQNIKPFQKKYPYRKLDETEAQ